MIICAYRNTNIHKIKMKLNHSVTTFLACDMCLSIQMVVGHGYWYGKTDIKSDVTVLLDVTRCWKCSASEGGSAIESTMRYVDLAEITDKIEAVCKYPDVINFNMTTDTRGRDWYCDRIAVRGLNMILDGLDYSYTCPSVRKNKITIPYDDFFRPGYQPSYVAEYYPTLYMCYKYLYCCSCTRVLSFKCMGDLKPMGKMTYKTTYKSEIIVTQCYPCSIKFTKRVVRADMNNIADNIMTRKLERIVPTYTKVVRDTHEYETENPIDIVAPLMDHCKAWSVDPHTSEIIDPHQDFFSSRRLVLASDTDMIAGTDPMLI